MRKYPRSATILNLLRQSVRDYWPSPKEFEVATLLPGDFILEPPTDAYGPRPREHAEAALAQVRANELPRRHDADELENR